MITNSNSEELGWSTQTYIDHLAKIPDLTKLKNFSYGEIDTSAAIAELNNLLNQELNLSREIGTVRQRLYKMTRLLNLKSCTKNLLNISMQDYRLLIG